MALLEGMSVLLVEDEDDTRDVLAEGLSRYGARVDTASSAEAAIDELRVSAPDVLVSDLALPELDGDTLLRMVRANPHLASIPAVALSGYGSADRRARSIDAGFQKHLVKPARLEDIVIAISSVGRATRPKASRPSMELQQVLEQLSRATGCRFASLLRFAIDDTLVSLWTYDREQPDVDPFPLALPIHASYCVLVRATRKTIAIENAMHDERVAEHPKRFELGCYLGAPLFCRDGRIFGTVCCYDEMAHTFDERLGVELERTARRLEPELWRLFDADVAAPQ